MKSAMDNRYIFCASPGRSGSHYLQRVFDCATGVCSVHEPEHQYSEYAPLKPGLWDLKNTPFSNTTCERRKIKLAQVHDLLGKSGATIYAETNPLFSTLWHDVVLDALTGQDVTVIILRRNASAVLKSLLDLGWFQGKDGNRWMVTAYSVNSLVNSPVQEKSATAAELIIGYLMNVECYTQRIRQRCEAAGHRVIELNSQQLFEDARSIDELASRCGLVLDRNRLAELDRDSQNKQTLRKKSSDVSIDACKNSIDDYLDLYRRNNMPGPDLFYQ